MKNFLIFTIISVVFLACVPSKGGKGTDQTIVTNENGLPSNGASSNPVLEITPANLLVAYKEKISMSYSDDTAAIRYTIGDGSQAEPTADTGDVYDPANKPIIDGAKTLKIGVFKDGSLVSESVIKSYKNSVSGFNKPYGVAVDKNGNIYVADTFNHQIQKFDADGNFIKKWGTNGIADGQFNKPFGVGTDEDNYVYVADMANHRIQKFDSEGVFVTKWGIDGTTDGKFKNPSAVAIDANGNVYVADTWNHRIQKFDTNGTFKAKWSQFTVSNTTYGIGYPYGVAVDAAGNVYINHQGAYHVVKFNANGTFINQWGEGKSEANPGPADGQFSNNTNFPSWGIAVDAAGNVYASDRGMFQHRVQKFSPNGAFSSKCIGGCYGVEGNPGWREPFGLAVDKEGNVYVADSPYSNLIRKIRL